MARSRLAWRLRIRPGREAEYRRRHAEAWPEVYENLRRQGVVTFSIFVDGLDVFLYCETDPDMAVTEPVAAAESGWRVFMSEILEPVPPVRRLLDEVFHYEPEGRQ